MNKLSVLVIVMFLGLTTGCDSSTEKKEASKKVDISREIGSSEKFLSSVSEVHKKQDFLSESFVSFQFKLKLDNEQIEGKVTSRTNLTEFLVETEVQGSFYFNVLDGKYTSDQNNKKAEQLISFVVSNYHLFYSITGENYSYSERENQEFLERPYYSVVLKNEALPTIFPKSFEVFVEQRTNMLKGVSLPNPQKPNDLLFLQYDKFITVNRIPVSLQWNIFKVNGSDKMSKSTGEANITAIKYLKENEVDLVPQKPAL